MYILWAQINSSIVHHYYLKPAELPHWRPWWNFLTWFSDLDQFFLLLLFLLQFTSSYKVPRFWQPDVSPKHNLCLFQYFCCFYKTNDIFLKTTRSSLAVKLSLLNLYDFSFSFLSTQPKPTSSIAVKFYLKFEFFGQKDAKFYNLRKSKQNNILE